MLLFYLSILLCKIRIFVRKTSNQISKLVLRNFILSQWRNETLWSRSNLVMLGPHFKQIMCKTSLSKTSEGPLRVLKTLGPLITYSTTVLNVQIFPLGKEKQTSNWKMGTSRFEEAHFFKRMKFTGIFRLKIAEI